MSDAVTATSAEIAAQADSRRAALSATAASLRVNLTPGNLFDEAKGAAGREASSLLDAGRKAVGSHPLAALAAAAGAAVVIGSSMKKKTKAPMDMAGLTAASEGAKPSATLRGRVAEGLGALAQSSFQLVQERYAQKVQAFQTAAKSHVRSLTEEILDAGEGAIAAMLSALAAKLAPRADGSVQSRRS